MASLVQMFIGKKLSPEELVKKWRQSVRVQERELDKQIRGIDAEEVKVQRTLKQAAKKGDTTTCRMLCKEIVRSRRAKTRMYTSKAQLNSMMMQLQQQLATMKVAGAMKKNTEVMKLVNTLVKVPELSMQLQEMSQEMMKAGIIDEMIQDTIEMQDEDGLEEEAEQEVEKVLFELTDGLLGLPSANVPDLTTESNKQQEKDTQEMEDRLMALKN